MSPDPNSGAALAWRHEQLEHAWKRDGRNRLEIITDICAGKRVLDVGCVDHETKAMASASWLHASIAKVASECVGVDIEASSVGHLREAGYDVVCADVTQGAGPLAERLPFEVVVAGELVEHLGNPQALFEFAAEALGPGGTFVLTTPSPYAPGRVRASQLRALRESVDHVVWLFPSGVAELASRSGLQLCTACTVAVPYSGRSMTNSLKEGVKAVLLRVGGRKGQATGLFSLPLPSDYITPVGCLVLRSRSRQAQVGDTAVYVLTK